MIQDDPGAEPAAETRGPLVSFLNVVSLGNVLIFLGMVGTGMLGIYEVGGQVQKLQDAISHEADMRSNSEQNLTNQIASLSTQENRDMLNMNNAIVAVRDDVRSLMQLNPSAGRDGGTVRR